MFVAIRPASRSLVTAQGKGLDADSARTSALMESAECWHAENPVVPIYEESAAALRKRKKVLDLDRLATGRAGAVAVDELILWTEGWDIVGDCPVSVPYDCVTLNCLKRPRRGTAFPQTSNGLASGNHLLEAVLHGLLEVIERDSVQAWQESSQPPKKTQVDPETVRDPHCCRILDLFTQAGVNAGIWDATSELEVPTYAVEIFEDSCSKTWRACGNFAGYGSHLAPEVALSRALSEAAQSRLAFISGSRDDLYPFKYEFDAEKVGLRVSRIKDPAPTVPFSHRLTQATPSFEGDLSLLLERLKSRGIQQVGVVDLTRDELGMPVVKVVVPGLRSFRPKAVAV